MPLEHVGETVLPSEQISEGVRAVARRLNERYTDAVVITVVPGGILHTADLVRNLDFDVSMDTISCPHTPGQRTNDSEILYRPSIDINGRDVIVVDDAVESGGTMKRLVAYLTTQYSPASIAVAVLFVKPGRVDVGAEVYYAHEMDSDDLLVGYGLPWEHKYRNIGYVSTLVR